MQVLKHWGIEKQESKIRETAKYWGFGIGKN